MSLASLWQHRQAQKRAKSTVRTQCVDCGCIHPRRYDYVGTRLQPNGRCIAPCIKCTEMRSRSKGDIVVTEQRIVATPVHGELPRHTLAETFDADDELQCPRCGAAAHDIELIRGMLNDPTMQFKCECGYEWITNMEQRT